MHPVEEFFAEAVYERVVRAHALLHDFGSDADHVRVANLAALDDADDVFARAQLAGHRIHAQDSGVGAFERIENRLRCARQRTRRKIFQQKFFAGRAAHFNCACQACGNFLAGAVGNEGDAFTGLDREAGFDCVSRARDEFFESRLSRHMFYCNFALRFFAIASRTACKHQPSGSTTMAGTCPPPDVTFARPVELSRVRNPAICPRKR